MNAAQTFGERALPLHTADRPTLKLERNTALTGVVVGAAMSLPLWAAIVASGKLVLRWL